MGPMTRPRLAPRWSGQLLRARPALVATRRPPTTPAPATTLATTRRQSSSASTAAVLPDDYAAHKKAKTRLHPPSPPHHKAPHSAKLAALHARLLLSNNIPLQTLARALVNVSADPGMKFNNSNLAFLGNSIINYHVLEYLMCKWPRLPTLVLFEAVRAYSGPESLQQIARRWGVEAAAAPGHEVDPGLLQWRPNADQTPKTLWGRPRSDTRIYETYHYRRSISSRVVFDDVYGDPIPVADKETPINTTLQHHEAYASFVQAVVGSIYAYCGHESAKSFVSSHILSRQLDPSGLFEFKLPTRELAMLCAREGFKPPLARLESETGRHSRTPVFVVGIYSGDEKLGEAAGACLDHARRKACIASLKAWYLYSPGNKVRVPSDMMEEDAKPWTPPHIDVGEVI